jgi:hypothetical protein
MIRIGRCEDVNADGVSRQQCGSIGIVYILCGGRS